MSITIIPNNQNVQLATPVYELSTDELAMIDLKPIIGWACEDFRKEKSKYADPVVTTTPLTALGTSYSDSWAIYHPKSEIWETHDQSGKGLDQLEKYFNELGEADQEEE